jgi:hypothetical protein
LSGLQPRRRRDILVLARLPGKDAQPAAAGLCQEVKKRRPVDWQDALLESKTARVLTIDRHFINSLFGHGSNG